MVEVVVILLAALATSVLSAIAGLGGGVILLVVLAQFLSPVVAIPIQGAIQFAANGSRAFFLRGDVSWPAVGWSAILLLPASFLGASVATALPEAVMRAVLGGFVLLLAWRPKLLKWTDPDRDGVPAPVLVGVGATSGFLNSTVGASGPVTSPFFRAATVSHVAFVATAAMTQVLAHASKLLAFSAGGFDLRDHAAVIAAGVVGVVLGSRIGTKLVGRIEPDGLDTLFKVVLTALAVRLIATAVL